MREFDALRSRVEDTAARLAAAQSNRRDRNMSLLDTVGRLEAKFAAQEQELAYYRDRIRPLETANAQLSALMSRLLDMVDGGLGDEDDADDPVRAATVKAAAMLEHDLMPLPPQPDMSGSDGVESEISAEPLFDDVDGGTLAAESAAEDDARDMPSIVQIAAAAADTDTWAEDVAAEDADAANAPSEEIESVDALADALGESVTGAGAAQPTAADIRALLERVEAAAAEVRAAGAAGAGSKPASGSDRVTPMPARRRGGAAA